MKPSLFDIMEDIRWEYMKSEEYDEIGQALKQFYYDIPWIPQPDSIKYFIGLEAAKEKLVETLTEIAAPYIDDLSDELAEASLIDAQIHEVKCHE